MSKITRRKAIKSGLISLAAAPILPGFVSSTLRAAEPDSSKISHEPAVVTVSDEADAAARLAFQQGGNAIDAAIAAMLAITVLYPDLVGVGGYGGSMVIYLANKKRVTAIDFDSRAPLAFKPELYPNMDTAFHGYLATGVPGVVAGFDLALKKFGRLKWKQVVQHARELAEAGAPVTQRLETSLKQMAKIDSASFKAYFPDGKIPAVGERLDQKDLAKLLGELGEGGANAFYHGDIAKTIVKQVRENGGILTEEDFKEFKAQEVEPARVDYRGDTLHTPPPPSGGLTSLCMVKTLEQFDVPNMKPWGAEYFHTYAQASKLCWAERFGEFGDPDSAKFSLKDLLSADAAKKRAQLIRNGNVPNIKPPPTGPKHTANVVVIDKDGNAVSMTATHGSTFGAQVVIGGLGLVLGHGMSRFTLEPGSSNYPAPGKRMQHNMSPLLITRKGRPLAAMGLPGGRLIVSVTAQLALGTLDFKKSANEVVTAPRVHTEGNEPILISSFVPDDVAEELKKMGHELRRVRVAGPSNLAIINQSSGKIDSSSGRSLA